MFTHLLARFVPVTLIAFTLLVTTTAHTEAAPETIQAILDETLTDNNITGFTLAVYTPQTGIQDFSAGVANAETQTPLTSNNLMYAGSVTKTFVAVATLQLVEDEVLSLDDTLDTWFPNYPHAEVITVQNLLNMTSGTFDYFRNVPDNPFLPVLMQDITHLWTPDEIIQTAGSMPPPALPNQVFTYSNTDYILLGRIIEMETGEPLHNVLTNRVFTPLGMNQTFMAGHHTTPDIAPGFVRDSAFLFGATEPMVTQPEHYSGLETLSWAAGGLVTTSSDLATGAYEVFAGNFVDDDTHTAMTTPSGYTDENDNSYGFGVEFYTTSIGDALGHAGSIPGYASLTLFIPEHDLSIAVITNDEYGEPLLFDLLNDVLQTLK